MQQMLESIPILSILVYIPLAGALAIVFLVPKAKTGAIKAWATIVAGLDFVVSLPLWFAFPRAKAGYQFQERASWIPSLGVDYHFGIDGISLVLILLTTFVGFIAVYCSYTAIHERQKEYYVLLLLLQTFMIGTFCCLDFFLFYVFWEVMLVPMYFLIGVWGGDRRLYAAIKFFLYTLAGSVLMLLGIIALYFYNTTGFLAYKGLGNAPTFSIEKLTAVAAGMPAELQVWLFFAFFFGFAIKVPMFPFHTWLPDAHTEAPTVGSVLLAAILLKLGTYGFIRIALPILPDAASSWAPWIGLLAVIGIIYGALCCLAQRDLKRLIAFSSVAHMGFVMLAIATLTVTGINAAVFGMVAHGLITGMLFFLAGSIGERYGTREMRRLGGVLVQAPRLGWILGFCAMASLGLPGLAGFWGEFPAILSAYDPTNPHGLWGGSSGTLWTFRVYMVIAAIGTVLAAGYLLWMFQRVAFGKVKSEFEGAHVHDVHWAEWFAW